MTCKYLDQTPDRKQACKLPARVCQDWLKNHHDEEFVSDTEKFCIESSDDFEPDIV